MFDSNYNANSIPPIHHHHHHHQTNNNNISFDDHLLNNFPSHLLDDALFLDTILPYHHHHPSAPLPPPQPQEQPPERVMSKEHKKVVRKAAAKKQDGGGGGSSKRKAGKKDRHSKIYTAHGPRDRRMRLSLQIARKFFDLQDLLGFDKASKTIEWLFNKSRAAIKDLSEESCTNIIQDFDGGDDIIISNKKEKFMMSNNKGGMVVCEVNEKRKQARARARERTKEKLMKNKKKECNLLEIEKENPNNTNTATTSLDDVIRVDKVHQLEDQMASVGIIENFLASSSSSSSSMANFSHHLISRGFSMEFPGNRVSENGSGNDVGLMHELVGHSDEYTNHVQGLNCAFMDREYNQGF